MSVTVSIYNHTAKLLFNKEVDLTALKVELLDNTASFIASHTAKTSVDNAGAKEVYGNGWTQGGMSVPNVTVTTVTTNDAKLDGDDISVTASGGAIGPAYAALLYDSSTNKPLAYIDLGGAESAGITTDFKIVWHSDGIFTVTV